MPAPSRKSSEAVAGFQRISVCVCTYRRPQQLAALIKRLAEQQPPPILELVVVDNDAHGSAAGVVAAAIAPFPLRYSVQPVKNIALTRNQALAAASGDWIAFLDDDELPLPDWLQQLWRTAELHSADGVLAPVISQVPDDAPDWIKAGNFFARRRFTTGTVVPRNEYRIGNALLRADCLKALDGPFDAAYGLTGGEDGDLLCRYADQGARLVWCDEAVVTEPVEHSRLNRHWLLKRAWRGGNDYARHYFAGRYGPLPLLAGPRFMVRTALQWLAAAALQGATLPVQRCHFHWQRKAAAQRGKLAALRGSRYEEYR